MQERPLEIHRCMQQIHCQRLDCQQKLGQGVLSMASSCSAFVRDGISEVKYCSDGCLAQTILELGHFSFGLVMLFNVSRKS